MGVTDTTDIGRLDLVRYQELQPLVYWKSTSVRIVLDKERLAERTVTHLILIDPGSSQMLARAVIPSSNQPTH